VIFMSSAGRGRGRQHLPRTLVKSMRSQLATLVRGSSVTAHCLAATALLTREYQGDHRRHSLTSTASRATHYPLDISFHIRFRDREAPGIFAVFRSVRWRFARLALGVTAVSRFSRNSWRTSRLSR